MNVREKQKLIVTKLFTDFYSKKENLSTEIDTKWFLKRIGDDLKPTFKKTSVRKIYEECGINPLCIINTVRWSKGVDRKLVCYESLIEIGERLGYINLNDNSMNSSKKIDLPKSLELQHNGKLTFPLSEKLGVKNKKVSLQSIYKKCIDVTGLTSWRDVLSELGMDLKKIERKRSKNTFSEVLSNYITYKKENKIQDYLEIKQDILRKENSVLWKQILKIEKELNYNIKLYTKFYNGIKCLEYYVNHQKLPNKDDFLSKETENNFKKFLLNQDEIKWNNHTEILQDLVLGMYVRGSSIYNDDNKTDIEKRVTNKIRHWKGKKSTNVYKNMGIMMNELQKMKSIINDKYDRKKIYSKLRELLKKTINTGVNHLSKEYIEKNEYDFMVSCFKVERITTNNWGKILKLYGINGDLFLPDRLDISNRGIKFEVLIKELFSEHLELINNKSDLNNSTDFWYKKKQGSIIPDFTFQELIIDTKFSIGFSKSGFNHQQITNQLKKYHQTKKEIVILTFNQKEEILTFGNQKTKIINLKTLSKFLYQRFNIQTKDSEIKYIFNQINNIKFYRRYKGFNKL